LVLGLCLVPGARFGSQEAVVIDFGEIRDGVPRGWELSAKEGRADLTVVREGNHPVLRLRSDSSSFALQREVEIDIARMPFLVWQWKVTELPRGGDFRKGDADDQAAQLFVMFSSGLFRTDVIAYLWDSTAPAGTVGELPLAIYPTLRMKALVVRSGEANQGRWITETRNVVEDYRSLFGGDPDKVTGIRIQINSQHTKSKAESYWRSLIFKTQP
jgi:hypothetical protein